MNIIRRFGQKNVWVDREGNEHVIAEMDPRYAANVVKFLERRAAGVALKYSTALAFAPMPGEWTNAYDIVTAGIERQWDEMDADPVAWLRKKPLMIALRERAEQHEGEK